MNKTPAHDDDGNDFRTPQISNAPTIVGELTRAKVAFQQRTICTVIAPPFITENGKVSPLVPVAIIDRESDAGSYADALAHSVNNKQSDY